MRNALENQGLLAMLLSFNSFDNDTEGEGIKFSYPMPHFVRTAVASQRCRRYEYCAVPQKEFVNGAHALGCDATKSHSHRSRNRRTSSAVIVDPLSMAAEVR